MKLNLLAGRDTTAQALTWAIYRLMSRRDDQQRILKESLHLDNTTTYSDLTASSGPLRFTNAFISETLRLHPPVPLEIQENIGLETVVLPDGNVVGPGEKIIWSPWAMARSTRIWGEDAKVFRPERWLNSDHKEPTAFEWPVFHAGPRSCLGKNLARAELAYTVVQIVNRYELRRGWSGAEERVYDQGLTGPMKGGLPVYVRKRPL